MEYTDIAKAFSCYITQVIVVLMQLEVTVALKFFFNSVNRGHYCQLCPNKDLSSILLNNVTIMGSSSQIKSMEMVFLADCDRSSMQNESYLIF